MYLAVYDVAAVSAALIVRLLGSSYDGYATAPALAIFFGLLLGVACGAVNGFLVAGLNIQPMVATLIMYTAGRGIAQLISSKVLENGDVATGVNASIGKLYAIPITYANYGSLSDYAFISKGTLNNVLTATIGDIASVIDAINGESI